MKRYYIKSSTTALKQEVDQLRDQVEKLTQEPTPQVQKRGRGRPKTAVFSPPVELEAKVVEFEFETPDTDEF